jgi:hypothetical protein
MHASCMAYLTLHYFITLVMFGEVYDVRHSILCSLFEPPLFQFLEVTYLCVVITQLG